MSDTDDEFRLNLVMFNLRTRRAALVPQLHIDLDSLRLRDPGEGGTSSDPTTPSETRPGPVAPVARQRGRSVLEGIAPSWIDLQRGGVRIPGGPLLRPSIDLRDRGFKLELEWTW